MSDVGAYEAKTHLPRLLEEVAKGRSFTITKHGRPVARLVPVVGTDGAVDDVVREIKEARNKVELRGLEISDLIAEGRR